MDFLKLLNLLLQPVATVIDLTTAPLKKTGNDGLTTPSASDKLFSPVILLGLLASFGLASCSSTSQLRIKVMQPSKVTVGDSDGQSGGGQSLGQQGVRGIWE